MSKYYRICFFIHKEAKIKIDYSFLPVSLLDNNFVSDVSKETFKLGKKCGDCYIYTQKEKNSFLFQMVMLGDEKMEVAEKEMLSIVESKIRWRIPFRFSYKKKLHQRIELLKKS